MIINDIDIDLLKKWYTMVNICKHIYVNRCNMVQIELYKCKPVNLYCYKFDIPAYCVSHIVLPE